MKDRVHADGAGLRVEAIAGEDLKEIDGRLVVPASGAAIDDEMIQRGGRRHQPHG